MQLRAPPALLGIESREEDWRLSFTGRIRMSWMGIASRISNKVEFP
ncbi:MAG TPA: hypothetical protein GX733_00335 [Tissierellia bacterium]|nr:hypothetical protein [Tissierellia bacterium]